MCSASVQRTHQGVRVYLREWEIEDQMHTVILYPVNDKIKDRPERCYETGLDRRAYQTSNKVVCGWNA